MDDNKKRALDAALAQIDKQFGKGSIMRLGEEGGFRDVEAISTGSLNLDIALGIGPGNISQRCRRTRPEPQFTHHRRATKNW